jgi:hypothetical protein
MVRTARARERFHIELIKPSHYDDDGYVIQWMKAWVPSNSLACLYGLARHAADNRVFGEDVEVSINAYDETNTVIPVRGIIRRLQRDGGIVCMVGVQSNQFPRCMDMARRFRAAGLQVAIGGFHVSGCLAMLPHVPPDIQEAIDLGMTIFAGEAEGRFNDFLRAAYRRELRPLYNYMSDLPPLEGQVLPRLPRAVASRYAPVPGTFDAGRGCPFLCSFCTIINVQGRKSRHRSADDVERLLRANLKHGIRYYFLTDDNFARNRNWEPIFDRIAELRAELGVELKFTIQVDTLCHKIPNFIDKARQAGVSRVFIGLENINSDNLQAAHKRQNKVAEYRAMLLAWKKRKITTYCGYILGFPADTAERILEDIETVKRELPLDILEFFCLTPLPGSADHKELQAAGAPLDPDMNIYDLEHVCTAHPKMSVEEWRGIYDRAWDAYYSMDHIETLMRRTAAAGRNPKRIFELSLQFYGCYRYLKVHPLQGGFLRRKIRTERRSTRPRENPLVFYPRRALESMVTFGGFAAYAWRVYRLFLRVRKETQRATEPWMDEAIGEMFAVPAVEEAPRERVSA